MLNKCVFKSNELTNKKKSTDDNRVKNFSE